MATIGDLLLQPESGWQRIDGSDSRIIATGTVTRGASSSYYNGTYLLGENGTMKAKFFIEGTKRLRLIGIGYPNIYTHAGVIKIDGVQVMTFTQYDAGGIFIILNADLSDISIGHHVVEISNTDNQNLLIDAIDIDSGGTLTAYSTFYGKTKTSIPEMKIGDRISFEYTAKNNTFGTIANLGKATKPEIPIGSSATPDGTAYFIHMGYDLRGKMKLVADRNIQHSISWDTLNNTGIASGSGLPISIDGKDDYTIRLLSGGVSATDKDNEWDKIIAESTLADSISAGDNFVWNWKDVYSWISNVNMLRGFHLANEWYGVYTQTNWSTGFRPVLLVEPDLSFYLFQKEDHSVHSLIDNTLTQISPDWRNESDTVKREFFKSATQSLPNISMLQQLGKFKVLIFSDLSMLTPTCSISAVPKKRMVKPKALISLASFEGIDKATLTASLSGTGAVRLLVTTDLITYKAWNGTAWQIVDTNDITEVETNGMTPAQLAVVPRTAWDSLTSGMGGLGFAYLPSVESVSDTCSIDKIELQVDMKGSWDKAFHGTDYIYGYPRNNILRVTLKNNGDYKVNYSEGEQAI